MKLIFANRNYSSWSLRVWLVLAHFGIEFEEELVMLSGPGWQENIRRRSPSGKVPVLVDGALAIPESIAIIEYLAERFPDRGIWPAGREDRALARAAAAEVHGGFNALRTLAPMNLRASYPGRVAVDAVADDLKRAEALWGGFLAKSKGRFLFGDFCAADAMFAPLASRLRTYGLPVSDVASAYVEAIYALPAFQTWLAAAVIEPWTVPEDELADPGVAGSPLS